MKRYLAKNKIDWPTIVDSNREFEKAVLGRQISLNSIRAFKTIDTNGDFGWMNGSIKDTADKLLTTASWNIDSAVIPPSLRTTWQAVEFGNFKGVSKTLSRSLDSKDDAVKRGAEAINNYIQLKVKEAVAEVNKISQTEKPWESYKAHLQLESQFSEFLGEDTEKTIKELKKVDAVKNQLAASRQLNSASKTAAKSGIKKVLPRLKKLIEKYPGTEAAKTAQEVLDKAEAK